MIVIDTKTKEKTIARMHHIRCKACEVLGVYTVIKKYHYFHINFIPLMKWGTEYYVRESECGSVFKLDKDAGKAIERGLLNQVRPGDIQAL